MLVSRMISAFFIGGGPHRARMPQFRNRRFKAVIRFTGPGSKDRTHVRDRPDVL